MAVAAVALSLAAQALLLNGMGASATARAGFARAMGVQEPAAEVSDGVMAFDVPSVIVGGGRIGSLLLDLGCEGACHLTPCCV